MCDKLQEAARFFRQEKGLARLMKGIGKQYYRLGRIGGTVRLENLTDAEKEALSGLLGRDFHHQKSATISMDALQKSLEKTRFSGIDLKDLLFAYNGKEILTREEETKKYSEDKNIFFQELLHTCQHTNSRAFIEVIKEKKPGTRGVHKAYDQDPGMLDNCLENVIKGLDNLPQSYERLPAFAHRTIKDPHGFDMATDQGRLFIFALKILLEKNEGNSHLKGGDGPEEVTEILEHFNIIRDDILNFTTCIGVIALNKKGELEQAWQAACASGMVLNLPLREIVKAHSLVPYLSTDETLQYNNMGKKVFVVENSGVFSAIVDTFNGQSPPPLVCTHGQFRLASLLLLDKLAASGCAIYYSGDFDPEGLSMAQRLLYRYKDSLKLWHFTLEDYHHGLSNNKLSDSRLKMLKNIQFPSLIELANEIKKQRMSGYQEEIIPKLIKDIKESIR